MTAKACANYCRPILTRYVDNSERGKPAEKTGVPEQKTREAKKSSTTGTQLKRNTVPQSRLGFSGERHNAIDACASQDIIVKVCEFLPYTCVR